ALSSLGAALVRPPISPFAIERAVREYLITHDAATLPVAASSKSDGHHISIRHSNAIVLFASVPTELVDVAVFDNFQRAFVGTAVLVCADDCIVAGDIRRRRCSRARCVAVSLGRSRLRTISA